MKDWTDENKGPMPRGGDDDQYVGVSIDLTEAWEKSMSFWTTLRDWFTTTESHLIAFIQPLLKAYFTNLARVGINDITGFLEEAGPAALLAGEQAYARGLRGSALRDAVVAAIIPIAIKYGAEITSDAFTAVINTTVELLHQPSVVTR